MYNSGFLKSDTFGVPVIEPAVGTLPDNYDLRPEMDSPIDQGNDGICVSVCMTDMLKYSFRVAGKTYKKRVDYFYKRRDNKAVQGMTPRNAFEIAQADDFVTSFAMLRSVIAMRTAIVANGPVLIALPVYNFLSNFWESKGNSPIGYHAVTLVGYDDKEGDFILRNSWGTGWGLNGYSYFPYNCLDKVIETWTLFR